jgi:hypothetical protein
MGLFDFFKKKEQEIINIPIEDKKETPPDKIEITEISKPIINDISNLKITSKEIITETIYEFKGIDYNFIDNLYFVNEEQKNKVLKFINAVIKKFKFNDIKTQKDYFKFEDSLSKYYNFLDNYEDIYEDENGLSFPYFDYSFYVSWAITDIYSTRDSNGIITEKSRNDVSHVKAFDSSMSYFNIKNKTTNNLKDISFEEKILMDFFKNKNYFKYYVITSNINCLIEYYFKLSDFKKVDDLFDLLINKVEPEDKHNLEKDFDYLTNIFVKAGNTEKGIEYANKGIDYIKGNYPKPKTKTMGNFVYKKVVQLLVDDKEFIKALAIINEATAYNENLSFKQMQAKIEKELAK